MLDITDLIRSALRKLGPERCQQALVAFEHPTENWQHCVLARAYGPPGALFAVVDDDGVVTSDSVAAALGLTSHEVRAVVAAFDSPAHRSELRALFESVAAIAQPCAVT